MEGVAAGADSGAGAAKGVEGEAGDVGADDHMLSRLDRRVSGACHDGASQGSLVAALAANVVGRSVSLSHGDSM